MRPKMFDLCKLSHLSFFNQASKNGKNHHHHRCESKADQSEDGSLPECDREATEKHRGDVQNLADLFARAIRNCTEVFLNLGGDRFDFLVLEVSGLLSHEGVEVQASQFEGEFFAYVLQECILEVGCDP